MQVNKVLQPGIGLYGVYNNLVRQVCIKPCKNKIGTWFRACKVQVQPFNMIWAICSKKHLTPSRGIDGVRKKKTIPLGDVENHKKKFFFKFGLSKKKDKLINSPETHFENSQLFLETIFQFLILCLVAGERNLRN